MAQFDKEWDAQMKEEPVFDFTDKHLAVIRLMCVVWDSSESGAPIVLPDFPKGTFKRMCGLLNIPVNADIDFESSESEIFESKEFEMFANEVGTAFEIFLQNAFIASGRYTYENPLNGWADDEWRLTANNSKKLKINKQKTVSFQFTDQHRKLIRNSNCGWLEYYNCPGINSKRPYGNKTYFLFDMAEILLTPCPRDCDGDPDLTDDMEDSLKKLHYEEMLAALQVFLYSASIRTGKYCKTPEAIDFWQKKP